LHFQICEILLADSVWKAQTHHRAKCRQNWLSVVETLQFFEFSKWLAPPSWIVEFTKFYLLTVSGGNRRITIPNFVKIGQSVAKILNFFDFSRWWQLPSWIFEIVNFYLLPVSAGPRRITIPNFIKIAPSIA